MLKKGSILIVALALALTGCRERPPTPTIIPSPTGKKLSDTFAPTQTASPAPTPFPTPSLDTSPKWWQDDVFYLIFVRSFADNNGDGIGDFNGITQKLDYLNDGDSATTTDLGIDAIWLMPIMDSPSEHGYDVRDFYAVNPQYGTLDDFKELLTQAHKRGIHVIIDFILHNASEQNPWFVQSRDPTSPYHDWFQWSPKDPGWKGPWGQQVWYPLDNAFFYSYFWKGSPSLNVANPDVTAEIKKITDFWLTDVGVDGFRLDAIGILIREGSTQTNTPSTHQWLKDFHEYYKSLKPASFTVGEIWDKNEVILPYIQNGEIDLAFNFDLAFAIVRGVNEGNPSLITEQVIKGQQVFPESRYAMFTTNHDMDRLMTQLGNDAQKVKAAASVYLTLPGVPFIYYGEEIGMQGYAPDSGGRLPMQWSGGQNAGFSKGLAWLPAGAGFETLNVQNEQGKPLTILTHYQKLIRLRHEYEVIRSGQVFTPIASQPPLYSTLSVLNGEAVLVVVNLSGSTFANFKVSLASTPLTGGEYQLTDLFGKASVQQVTLNASGGFENLAPALQILPYSTLIYRLSVSP